MFKYFYAVCLAYVGGVGAQEKRAEEAARNLRVRWNSVIIKEEQVANMGPFL